MFDILYKILLSGVSVPMTKICPFLSKECIQNDCMFWRETVVEKEDGSGDEEPSVARMKKDLKALEFKQMTSSLTREKEKELVQHIESLREQIKPYQEHQKPAIITRTGRCSLSTLADDMPRCNYR
jgi:hypothetical protein